MRKFGETATDVEKLANVLFNNNGTILPKNTVQCGLPYKDYEEVKNAILSHELEVCMVNKPDPSLLQYFTNDKDLRNQSIIQSCFLLLFIAIITLSIKYNWALIFLLILLVIIWFKVTKMLSRSSIKTAILRSEDEFLALYALKQFYLYRFEDYKTLIYLNPQ